MAFLLREYRHGFLLVDPEYRCVLGNPAAASFFGVPLAEFVGDRIFERAGVEPNRAEALRSARKEGSTQPYELEVVRRDGSRVTGLVAPQPLFDAGQLVGSFEMLTEVATLVDSPHLHLARQSEVQDGDGEVALTAREREVLSLFRVGLATQTIAGRLQLSPNTVRNHLKNICQKYEVGSQIQLRERFAPPRMVERG